MEELLPFSPRQLSLQHLWHFHFFKQIYFSIDLLLRFCFCLPQVEIEAPGLEDQKQDAVVPPPAEKPEGDTVGADERIHHTNGQPDAPERVERAEEAITSQQDGERREEEIVDVAVSDLKSFFFILYVLFVHLSMVLKNGT